MAGVWPGMSEPIPVLTLWQPWASLCVEINPATGLPYKTIETRSWAPPEKLIGKRIALHAAARTPIAGDIGPWHVWCESGQVWWLDGRNGDPESSNYFWLPQGAIIATATLVDVVPIVGVSSPFSPELPPTAVGVHWHGKWTRLKSNGTSVDITDQVPYGDFTPGRFAWLLADVERQGPPVPFKGGQRLTRKWAP